MDENVLEDSQLESTDSLESAESLSDDTEHSENDMESILDSAVDSSGNDDTELGESIEDIGLSDLYDTETGGIPVYVVHSDDDTEEKLMDDELGGVPVVLTNDVSPIASYASNDGVSYQLPALLHNSSCLLKVCLRFLMFLSLSLSLQLPFSQQLFPILHIQ